MKDMKDYTIFTSEQLANLLSQEEQNLELINHNIDSLYDKIGPFTEVQDSSLQHWCKRKFEVERTIAEIKKAIRGKSSGKIVIEYENVSREDLAELYRHLNRFTFSGGSVKYETINPNVNE